MGNNLNENIQHRFVLLRDDFFNEKVLGDPDPREEPS